jgi:hypothetical protein
VNRIQARRAARRERPEGHAQIRNELLYADGAARNATAMDHIIVEIDYVTNSIRTVTRAAPTPRHLGKSALGPGPNSLTLTISRQPPVRKRGEMDGFDTRVCR